jgi:hypothetical protein
MVVVLGSLGLLGLLLFSGTAYAAVNLFASNRENIISAFERFKGWGYSLDGPQIPEMLPGIPLSVPVALGGYGVTNCTVFGGWILLAAFPFLRERPGLWEAVNIWDKSKKWSGIEFLSDAFGNPIVKPPFAQGVYFAQSWMSSGGGHVRIVEVTSDNKIIVREASQSSGKVKEHQVSSYAWGDTRAVRIA